MDVWVDEMEKVGGEEWAKEDRREVLEVLVAPIEKMVKEGKLRPLREAAKECLTDENRVHWFLYILENVDDTLYCNFIAYK